MTRHSKATKAIVTRVAEYEQCPTEVLPAIEEKINSETYRKLTAVESLITEPLEFEYLWYRVNVQPDGEVIVTP